MMKIRRHKTVLVLAVVLGLLIFLHGVGILKPVENFLLFLVKPVSGRLYAEGKIFNRSYSARQNKENLQARVEELTQEVARLTVLNANYYELEEENKQLRAQLKFLNERNFKSIVAGIIAQENNIEGAGANQDLLINKGAKDGLRVGLGVVDAAGVIIGKISAVKETTANVCLTTSPGCKLAAALQNSSKTQGLTDGDLGLTIKMNYIPQNEKVAAGDTVVTSGLSGSIPRGLVIGQVTQVRSESNAVWQDATIVPVTNLNNLTVVSVIIP